jgi:hypothetical protein
MQNFGGKPLLGKQKLVKLRNVLEDDIKVSLMQVGCGDGK